MANLGGNICEYAMGVKPGKVLLSIKRLTDK